ASHRSHRSGRSCDWQTFGTSLLVHVLTLLAVKGSYQDLVDRSGAATGLLDPQTCAMHRFASLGCYSTDWSSIGSGPCPITPSIDDRECDVEAAVGIDCSSVAGHQGESMLHGG